MVAVVVGSSDVEVLDLDAVLPVDDGEAIAQLGASLGAIQAALLERVARFDQQERWLEIGATSMQSWLVARLDVTYSTARGWVDTAKALQDLPTIAATLGRGGVSLDQVRALCRFTTPDDEEDVIGWAPDRAASELQAIARDHEGVTVAEDQRSFEDREVSWWWSDDRRLHLEALLPPDSGVVVVKALERIAYQALPDENGYYEDFDARCADALYRMASQSIGADSDPDRATVVLHVDADILGGDNGAGLVEDGPLLPTETARRLGCDGRWQLFADFEGETVGIGRMSRRIPASLLRALRLRDRCCRFPGCERTGWLHAHHRVHWANGGRTDLDNLILLCGHHHRFVHEGGWTISGDSNGTVRFITRHGRPYAPRHDPLDRQRMARLVAAATGRPPWWDHHPP